MSNLVETALDRWRLLLVAAVVGGLLAFLASYAFAPIYRVRTVLAPAEARELPGGLNAVLGQVGGLASLAGLDFGGEKKVQEAIEILTSRNFTQQFIAENGLLPRLYKRRWDSERQAWRAGAEVPTEWQGYDRFDRKVRRVFQDRRSGFVTLEIDWTDSVEGAKWANRLVASLNLGMRQRAIRSADESIKYLESEYGRTQSIDVREAISKLVQQQMNSRMLASTRAEFAFRVLDPALPIDDDEFVRPNRPLFAAGGAVAGLIGAFALVQLRHRRATRVTDVNAVRRA